MGVGLEEPGLMEDPPELQHGRGNSSAQQLELSFLLFALAWKNPQSL